LTFQFFIPTADGNKDFSLESGGSIIFVGANGGGKTRLAVHIEEALGLRAHRISAHRALNLNPAVAKISEKQALMGLRTGNPVETARLQHRGGSRWSSKAAVWLLNDFDFLIQALFAEQSNTALKTHEQHKPGADISVGDYTFTKIQKLNEVWARLLPHRRLHISGDDIVVSVPGSQNTYKASEMSDGERAIFYMIGQVLVADEESVLIVDEPELHVHRSIMSKLWDELEALRPDCAFVFITHDLEFAAARPAQKFVIRDYDPAPFWTIEEVPEDSGFEEELTTLILGSRRPILFVEGDHTSLDLAIYRCCYPDWTVIPRGSCSEVIHSVVTLRKNAELTRITCSGIVDADDYQDEDKTYFADLGIATLPVSEIENMILLPDVSRAIALVEGFQGDELEERLSRLSDTIFETVNSREKIEEVAVRFCRRRIDRMLKKIDLSTAVTVADIESEYNNSTNDLDIGSIAQRIVDGITESIVEKDLPKLLAYYDNKGLLSHASSILKACKQSAFESWLTRALRNNTAPEVIAALSKHLPEIKPA